MNLDFLFHAPLWLLGSLAVTLFGLLIYVVRSGVQPPSANSVDAPPSRTFALHGLAGPVAQQHYVLGSSSVRVGRNPEVNDIVLPFPTVSGEHARVDYRQGSYFLRDLKSLNGTRLNGELFSSALEERERPVADGDRITFDTYEFRLTALPERRGAAGRRELGFAQTSIASWVPASLGLEPDDVPARDGEAHSS